MAPHARGVVSAGLAVTIVLGSAVACATSTGAEAADPETGQLTLLLTDAPFPFELVAEANVTIERVDVVGVAGVQTLAEGEQSFNLLDLQNGVTAVLGSAALPEGEVTQVRLIVTAADIVLTDGTRFDLFVPSGARTGIKINLPPGAAVHSGSETTATLDFSVSESFVVQGNPQTPAGVRGFIFKPVVTVIDTTDDSEAGGAQSS